MPILKRIKFEKNFVDVPNEIAQSEELTYEAKGLLMELLSRPDNWEIHKNQLVRKHTRITKINRIIEELKKNKYIAIFDKRDIITK